MRSGNFIKVDGVEYEIENTFGGVPAIYHCSGFETSGHISDVVPQKSHYMQLGDNGFMILVIKEPYNKSLNTELPTAADGDESGQST